MEEEKFDSSTGSCYVIKELLETEGLVRKTDNNGLSVLHWGVENNEMGVCLEMISQSTETINLQDNSGTTPLMVAVMRNHSHLVSLLLQSGADPTITNIYDTNALTIASANDNVEIIEMLIEHSTELREGVKNVDWTQHPVLQAAASGAKASVEFLYRQNPQCIHNIDKISGLNALMLAEAGGFKDLEEWLILHGAEVNSAVELFQTTPHTPLNTLSFLFPASPLFPPCATCRSPGAAQSSLLLSNASPAHPLTPTLCFSPSRPSISTPVKKKNSLQSWFNKLKRKRSKSLERVTEVKRRRSSACDVEQNNVLDYILSTAKLSEYRSCFIDQEVTFRTFLTLNEDELIEVGIRKPKIRKKILKLIQHYKRIFNAQI